MKKIFFGLGIIFMILTFCGAGYVLYTGGRVNAGYAVVPMMFTLAFMVFEARETYHIRKVKGRGVEYQAHYIDEQHNCNIVIQDTRDKDTFNLRFILDGFTFIGSSLYDFELANPEDYEEANLKFHLRETEGYSTDSGENIPSVYSLQRYRLSIEIPITVVDRSTSNPYGGEVVVEYFLKEHDLNKGQAAGKCDSDRVFADDIECTEFCLIFCDKRYFAEMPTNNFEQSLLQVWAKCSSDYHLECFHYIPELSQV